MGHHLPSVHQDQDPALVQVERVSPDGPLVGSWRAQVAWTRNSGVVNGSKAREKDLGHIDERMGSSVDRKFVCDRCLADKQSLLAEAVAVVLAAAAAERRTRSARASKRQMKASAVVGSVACREATGYSLRKEDLAVVPVSDLEDPCCRSSAQLANKDEISQRQAWSDRTEKVVAVQTDTRAHHITEEPRSVGGDGAALLALVSSRRQAANKRSNCATRTAAGRELTQRLDAVLVARVRGDFETGSQKFVVGERGGGSARGLKKMVVVVVGASPVTCVRPRKVDKTEFVGRDVVFVVVVVAA